MSSTNEPEQKAPQTPRPESATSESQKTAEQTPITEVDVLHAFVEEYKARDNQNFRIQRRNFLLGVMTAVLLFTYTTITALQWSTLLESNRINREALTSVQRAYVSFKFIESLGLRDSQGKVVSWQFFPQWENSGTTPTKIMRHHINANWFQESLPDGFGFQDLGSSKSSQFLLAAKAIVSSSPLIISPEVLAGVKESKLHLYFWGWAVYRDVFENSQLHLTEFCSELIVIGGDMMTGEGVRFLNALCSTHNCIDENCADYGETEKRLSGP